MRARRRLTLRRESLVELSTEELGQAVGGEVPPTYDCSLKVVECFSLEARCSWSCPL
jgi:hypothetical protein